MKKKWFCPVKLIASDLKDVKVGQAPQTSAGLGANFIAIPEKLSVSLDWNYYTDLYGFVDVEDVALASLNNETYQSEELNSYSLFDLGASYNLDLGGRPFQLFCMMKNSSCYFDEIFEKIKILN